MKIRYKLTTQDLTTFNDTQWVLKVWKETDGIGPLCTGGWLHCYSSPLLAILFNPIHADIKKPKLFKCEVEGKYLNDNGLKEGWTRMRIIKEIEIPQLTLVNKIAFGILCALEVNKDEKFVSWANNWLENKDRRMEFIQYGYSNSAVKYASYYALVSSNDVVHNSYAYAAAYAAEDPYSSINFIKLAKKAMEIK